MVETAGHDRSVDEHADLVAQAVAEAALPPVGRVKIRPVELVVLREKDPLGELDAAGALLPGAGEVRFQQAEDLTVEALAAAAVPKPQFADLACGGGPRGEGGTSVYIIFNRPALVRFEGLQREIDLIQGGRGEKIFLPFCKQGAVCREDDAKALLMRDRKEASQRRVQQRLAHQMKIEILRLSPQLFHKRGKKLLTHEALLPRRPGAEGAG